MYWPCMVGTSMRDRMEKAGLLMMVVSVMGVKSRCACVMVTLHHVFGHGRHQRERQDEGGEHCDDDRLRHGSEQVAGDAAELEEREPDDRDGQRGDQGGNDDLIGGVDDTALQRLAHCEMAVNVL